MSEPWTPGPWEFARDGLTLFNSDTRELVSLEIVIDKDADMRIIALAPEMAEALEQISRLSSDLGAVKVADLLLARARGENL